MIDLTQLNALIVDMAKVPATAAPLVRVAVQKTAADIKRDAQLFAPVDTGFLKGSIGYRTTAGATAVTAEIGPTAEYGHYVEFGTERMAPAAYMGPAFDRNAIYLDRALAQLAGGFL